MPVTELTNLGVGVARLLAASRLVLCCTHFVLLFTNRYHIAKSDYTESICLQKDIFVEGWNSLPSPVSSRGNGNYALSTNFRCFSALKLGTDQSSRTLT
jgi:hypothetical protein